MADAAPQPWEQQAGEGSEAFRAFTVYRDAGPGRTLAGTYRKVHPGCKAGARAPGSWQSRAKQHRWAERARAWDARADRTATAAREQVIAAAAATDQERQELQRQRETELVADLFAKAKGMLAFPLATKVVKDADGRSVTVIEPAKWSFGDAARIVELIAKLGRLNNGMPGEVATPKPVPTDAKKERVVKFRPLKMPDKTPDPEKPN